MARRTDPSGDVRVELREGSAAVVRPIQPSDREAVRRGFRSTQRVELPEEGIGEHMAGVLRVAAGGTAELVTPPWGLHVDEPT